MNPQCSQAELLAAGRLLIQYEQNRRNNLQKSVDITV
jgi:hypothetical protein